VLRVDFVHTYGTDPHLTSRSFWKYSGSAPSNGNCNVMAGHISAGWALQLAPLAHTNITLVEVLVTDLTSPTAGAGSDSTHHAGTRSGTGLTINDVANLNFQVDRRYRGGKPRMYGPWGTTADLIDPTHFGTTFTSAVDSQWSNFLVQMSSSGDGGCVIGGQVNISYYHGFASVQNPVTLRWRNIPTPRATPLVDPVSGHACSAIIGSQRRRLRV
jgi:hypothetical protein